MHCDEQQSSPVVHAAPSERQALTSGPHVGGSPMQRPAQQSDDVAHDAPIAKHGAVHTAIPAGFGVHVPRQQSLSTTHGVPTSTQGPPLSAQVPEVGSQVSQQGATPLAAHVSPGGEQVETASWTHVPSPGGQMPLQQSAFVAHAPPAGAQTWAAHTPPWHPVEQQSSAWPQGAPTGKQ
jgi:hypothetical protein